MTKSILLYGLGGADKAYTVINYYCVFEQDISIQAIMSAARSLKMNPEVKRVYALDNRRGLRKEYQDSIRENSIESHVIFMDTIEREGFRIY